MMDKGHFKLLTGMYCAQSRHDVLHGQNCKHVHTQGCDGMQAAVLVSACLQVHSAAGVKLFLSNEPSSILTFVH